MRISDWSSDVCSSDLHLVDEPVAGRDLVVDDERRRLLVVAHLQVLATEAPGLVGRRQPDGGERLDGEGLGDDLPGHIRLDRARELAAGSAEAALGRPDAAVEALQRGEAERKSVGEGQRVSGRVYLGGGRYIQKTNTNEH